MAQRVGRMTGTFESEDIVVDGMCTHRTCVLCGESKPLDDGNYYKNGKDDEGNQAYRLDCKVCYNVKRNENRTKNKHAQFLGHQRYRGEIDPELTFQEWKECLIFFGGECAYCGATPKRGKRLTKDHLKAHTEGGRSTQDNVVPACSSCNSSKGASDFRIWFMAQPFFNQERLNKIFKWRTILRILLKEEQSYES